MMSKQINMHLAWVEGVVLYLGWWLQSLIRIRDPQAPLGLRRLLLLIVVMPLFLMVQIGHGLALLLDELLFPGYRRQTIDRALFIIGVPRSASTFVHRTLSTNKTRYTTLTTWELLLAPALCQRKLLRALGGVDRRLGGWGRRAVQWLISRAHGEWDNVHEVSLQAPEEDYLALLPAGGCFVLLLAFPAARSIQGLADFDNRLCAARRKRLLALYEGCLQRHLYDSGAGRVLLSKNAALSSWFAQLSQHFPQARFVITLRDPRRALSSQISAVKEPAEYFGVTISCPAGEKPFVDHYAAGLQHLERYVEELPRERVAVIDAEDLRQHPGSTLRAALARLEEPLSEELGAELQRLDMTPPGPSSHHHDPSHLASSDAVLSSRLMPAYLGLLRSSRRVSPNVDPVEVG